MRVGVVGAGSIGCFVGGRLLAARAAEVTLVGRERVGRELAEHGLIARDFDREDRVPAAEVRYSTDVGALAGCDVVLVCVKSGQTDAVAAELASVLRADAIVASLQNGVRNPETLRARLGSREVLAAIVDFNVVSRGEGVFHRGMSGPLKIERPRSPRARELVAALRAAELTVQELDELAPAQWTKLLVNLNNAVSALTGAPTRELLASPALRRIIAAIIDEALGVLRAARIRPAALRGVPPGVMATVLRLPTPIVKLVTRAQMKVDAHARSSMWEDLERRRPTEVDFLNGEVVRLAERVRAEAPINRRIVELIHEAEAAGRGSPKLDARALADELGLPAK